MVKVIGPLGGFDASGSLAGSIVFSKWKGRNYVRRLVKPSNPKSPGQVGVRSMWKFLAQNWAGLTPASQATWNTAADRKVVSPFNAYMSLNQFNWRNFLAPSHEDPPTRAETEDVILTFTATAGVRQITIALAGTGINPDDWGYMIFRDLTTGFTPSVSNAVAVIKADGTNVVNFVDTPLVADEYFYDAKNFTNDGKSGTLKGEISAIVS